MVSGVRRFFDRLLVCMDKDSVLSVRVFILSTRIYLVQLSGLLY